LSRARPTAADATSPGPEFARPPAGRLSRAIFAFAAAFALHVAEEAPGFTAWAQRHASPRYTQRDFVRNNALGFAMTVAATPLAARARRRRAFFPYYAAVVTQQALFNALFHAGTTARYRAYSPGLATSVIVVLPLWWRITRLARRAGLLSSRGLGGGLAVGGAIHAAAVAHQVYFVGRRA
jgi:hypothetical protein